MRCVLSPNNSPYSPVSPWSLVSPWYPVPPYPPVYPCSVSGQDLQALCCRGVWGYMHLGGCRGSWGGYIPVTRAVGVLRPTVSQTGRTIC